MRNSIKIVLSFLLFLCLADMPYGYYQFVRFAAMIGFSVLAFLAYVEHKQGEMIVFIILALLFQPLIKIALGRTLWNVMDVVVGVGLLLSIFTNTQQRETTT